MKVKEFANAMDGDHPFKFRSDGVEVRPPVREQRFALAGAVENLLLDAGEIRDGIQPAAAVWMLVLDKDLAVLRLDERTDHEVVVSVEVHSLAEWTPKATFVRNHRGPEATESVVLDPLPGFPNRLEESADLPRRSLLSFWKALLAAREAAAR